MYSLLHDLLRDKKGGKIFTLFSGWHLLYIIITIIAISTIIILLKSKSEKQKSRFLQILIDISFGLYILDFFLMPLAYGEIDIEKLPFHICTAMCVSSFISTHKGSPFRWHFALLGFISNLVYLIYPAGVMWHAVHPLSYRVIQTLTFHSIMTVYGFLVLFFDSNKLEWKDCRRDLAIICGMTIWAMLGNYLYNGSLGDYTHFFNWFFVVRDPFYILPKTVAPFVMPFINILLFFAVEMLVYCVIIKTNKKKKIT